MAQAMKQDLGSRLQAGIRVQPEVDLQAIPDIAKARVMILSDGRTGGETAALVWWRCWGLKTPKW